MANRKLLICMFFLMTCILVGCGEEEVTSDEKRSVMNSEDVNDLFDKYSEVDVEEETNSSTDDYEIQPPKVLAPATILQKSKEARDFSELSMVYGAVNSALTYEEVIEELSIADSKIEIKLADIYNGDSGYTNLEEMIIDYLGEEPELKADCNENAKITIVIYNDLSVRVIALNKNGKIVTGHAYEDNDGNFVIMDYNKLVHENSDLYE